MHKDWKLISEKEAQKYSFLSLHEQKYQKLATDEELGIIVVSSGDASNVIPLTADLEVVLVRQYRFGIQADTLEIPGGLINPGENPLEGIQRELKEETGYSSTHWEKLGSLPFNPVYHKNYIHHYLAKDVKLTDETNFDLGESIELVVMPLPEVLHKVKRGKLAHPHTISGFMLAYEHLKTLIR